MALSNLHYFSSETHIPFFLLFQLIVQSYLPELSSEHLKILDAIRKIRNVEDAAFLKLELFVTNSGKNKSLSFKVFRSNPL